MLFREEMIASNGLTADAIGQRPPDRKRTAHLFIPAIQSALLAPQRQQRTGHASPRIHVVSVMLAIQRSGRPVFLADRMDARRVADRLDLYLPSDHAIASAPAGSSIGQSSLVAARNIASATSCAVVVTAGACACIIASVLWANAS